MIIFSSDSESIILTIVSLVVVLPLIVFLIVLGIARRSPEARGQRGEESVLNMLTKIAEQKGGYIINDVILPNGNRTAQIDHIYISKCGVFVIETKNYSGRIYGNEESTYWTQVLSYGNVKNKMYSPLKQNATHIYAVKKIIGKEVDITPMVIFVKGNTGYIDSNKVYTMREARDMILSSQNRFTISEISIWYGKLRYYVDHPIATQEEHIQHVKEKSSAIEDENNRRNRRRKIRKAIRRF